MKKRLLLYVVFGLVFYLLFLVVQLPASWFAWGLNYYSHGTIQLDPLSGSLWRGKGRLVIYYPQTLPHDFGQTEWSLSPFWLLTGRIQLELQTNLPDRQIKVTLGVSRGRFAFKDTDAVFPATFVSQLYPPAALISPQGQVRLRTSNLVFSEQNLEGDATIEWRDAGSRFSNVRPLGDYRLDITGAGKTANLKLATLRGDLELTGQGQWQLTSGQLQFTGSAVAQKREKELESLMQLLGNDLGSGRRSFSLTYHLPF
ncbi:MAG: type II secretion system protein N [Gammaproteobacteria bacterium]|nr:type II secretion system protein N [Gammaproteobacteria bacterium]